MHLNYLIILADALDLSINTEKTKAKHLGKPLTFDHYPHGFSWIKTPLETLGIFIMMC